MIVPEGIFTDVNGDYVVEDANGNKCNCTAVRKDYSSCKPCSWSDAVQAKVIRFRLILVLVLLMVI